jgi:hypothetical protein
MHVWMDACMDACMHAFRHSTHIYVFLLLFLIFKCQYLKVIFVLELQICRLWIEKCRVDTHVDISHGSVCPSSRQMFAGFCPVL